MDTHDMQPNIAETMRDIFEKLGSFEEIGIEADALKRPHLITLPQHRTVQDLTPYYRVLAEYHKPLRRKGTAQLEDLQSIIAWANRFKGETSVFFAKPDMNAPALTCIADYHASGATTPDDEDPTARHCHHRAIYKFPVSDEWRAWMGISGKPMAKDDLGEFIEAQAKDIMDPTPAVMSGTESADNAPWENRLIQTARQIEGRYGQLGQLLAMSRQFQVYETSNLTVSTNRDTGESEVQFLNEHKGADGKPLRIPNLIIIAIPVFRGGAAYRMPVRFRYRKMGGEVRFILSVYNPEKAFEASFDEALTAATEATKLPIFMGSPEA